MSHRPARPICRSTDLAEGGPGVRFRQRPDDEHEGAFVVRYMGNARAYVNRCPHSGTELDWQPGQFFEEAGLYLMCSTHGAIFEPHNGYCVAGPCRGASLQAIEIRERDGQVLVLDDDPENDKPAAR